MGLEAELNGELKRALKEKDSDVVACIRQVKAKVQEFATARGFSGTVDDALYRKAIGAYAKQLQKGLQELAAAGDRGRELREQYQAEIRHLEKYLPKALGEDETRELVLKTIAALGVTDPKRSGQVIGAIMKEHKEGVDPALVRRIVEEALRG